MSNNFDNIEISKFENMDLKDSLLRGIFSYGFEKPSVIQQKAIKPLSQGKDIIAQAQSGTGKTGTFCIGSLQLIDESNTNTQIVIISPTRELARQTYTVCSNLNSYLDYEILLLIGGSNINEAKTQLKKGVQIVIGTPGRLLHMLNDNYLDPKTIRLLVIDEADELLSIGFEEQIQSIMYKLSKETQIALFSATLPEGCLNLAKLFMNNPLNILVKKDEITLEGIKQYYINVEKEDYKLDTICDLYETLTVTQAVIFCSSIRKVNWLHEQLSNREFTVSSIHGELEDKMRIYVMNQFRSGSSRILISTDLLARGIDVQQISLVINYDMPRGLEGRDNYIHRIGRGGRFGRKGVAINFITNDDIKMLRAIEEFYSTQIDEMPMNIADIIV
jgi:translation initiation factor 4A